MIKIAICDDDSSIRNALSTIIKKYFTKIQRAVLVKVFASGEGLLSAKIRFDIIFLDIEMPVLDGLETARRLRNWDVNSKIIYVTNYNNHKEAAYKVHAFEYISKPVNEKEIENVLIEALRYIDNQLVPKKFVFKTERGIITLSADDIYYFEYCVRKLYIVTTQGTYISKFYTMKEIQEKTSKYHFVLTHRSYIVNLLHIKFVKEFQIFLSNGMDIPLAQKQSAEFRNAHTEFLNTTFD